jgi:hypothetical protein
VAEIGVTRITYFGHLPYIVRDDVSNLTERDNLSAVDKNAIVDVNAEALLRI